MWWSVNQTCTPQNCCRPFDTRRTKQSTLWMIIASGWLQGFFHPPTSLPPFPPHQSTSAQQGRKQSTRQTRGPTMNHQSSSGRLREDSEEGNPPLHGFHEGNRILFDIRFIFPHAVCLLLFQGLLDAKATAAKTTNGLAFTAYGPGESGAEEELQDWESVSMVSFK